jgi:hypothetical protein
MRTLYLVLILSIYSLSLNSQNTFDTAWVSSFGGPAMDSGIDLKETIDKGFILVGTTSTFGNGSSSFYIIKTDSQGIHKWSKTVGSNNIDVAYSVETTKDGNYFFTGYSNSNIQNGYDGYVIKANSTGDVLWSKNYGGEDWDFFYNSSLLPDGGLLLCGESFSNAKDGSDAYIVRTNNNGDTLWTKKINESGNGALYSIENIGNRIYAVGYKYDTLNKKTRAVVYKFDLNGNLLDQDIFLMDSSKHTVYKDLYITKSGNILLSGKSNNDTIDNYIILKVDTNFAHIKYSADNKDYYFQSIIEGNKNDVYAIGTREGGLGGKAVFLQRTDSNIVILLSAANFGGPQDEIGSEIIRTRKGYAFIGSTKSYGNQNSSGDYNVYLVIFNKADLVADYFLIVQEFQDTLSPVGIPGNGNFLQSTIFPNPVKDKFSIRLNGNSTVGRKIIFQLFSSEGLLVDEEYYTISDNNCLSLKRNDLKSGLYFYRVLENNMQISSGKLLAE